VALSVGALDLNCGAAAKHFSNACISSVAPFSAACCANAAKYRPRTHYDAAHDSEVRSHLIRCRVLAGSAITAMVLAGSAIPAATSMISPLTITPTFDSSITSDPNGASIEASINAAIDFYTTTLTTATASPIDVTIDFKEGGGLGGSSTTLYKVTYQSFINALIDASSGDLTDTTALAGFPTGPDNPVTDSADIDVKTAELRALGYTGLAPIGGFDGTITLNTALTDPGSAGSSLSYSLMAVTEHEIDEVLGLGSDDSGTGFFADPAPEDLFRYDSSGNRSYTTNPLAQAYFSINGTTLLAQFDNQNDGGDWGDWQSNPLPAGVAPQVQDAFGTPGSSPFLSVSSPEVSALDALGYNLVATIGRPTNPAI
jgi:hypothetical protein